MAGNDGMCAFPTDGKRGLAKVCAALIKVGKTAAKIDWRFDSGLGDRKIAEGVLLPSVI